jgi:hypothetical protein
MPLSLDAPRDLRPGRVCPADYLIDPVDFVREPDISADTLYVVGGLYGNVFALEAIEALAAGEPSPATIVFNGDVHWFDAASDWFGHLEAKLTPYLAIAGNVERELAREIGAGVGCGCAYPPEVGDDTVERSNEILARLRGAIGSRPSTRKRLGALPKTFVARIGDLRVGIVHGDPTSIAGWGFSRENLDDNVSRPWLGAIHRASRIDIFASTHTCGAVMRDLALPTGRLVVANNGAAGMANFDGDTRGIITRVSTHPSPHLPFYGLTYGGTRVDALPVAFDLRKFLQMFDRVWPQGSPAEVSYRARIHGQATGSSLSLARPVSTGVLLA